MDTRDVALTVLLDIETNQTFSNIALEMHFVKPVYGQGRTRFFIQTGGGCHRDKAAAGLCDRPVFKDEDKKCKPVIACLLRMGCYQILFMDSVPDSAACNECVKLAKNMALPDFLVL